LLITATLAVLIAYFDFCVPKNSHALEMHGY